MLKDYLFNINTITFLQNSKLKILIFNDKTVWFRDITTWSFYGIFKVFSGCVKATVFLLSNNSIV